MAKKGKDKGKASDKKALAKLAKEVSALRASVKAIEKQLATQRKAAPAKKTAAKAPARKASAKAPARKAGAKAPARKPAAKRPSVRKTATKASARATTARSTGRSVRTRTKKTPAGS